MAGKAKPGFYIAVGVVILVLVGFAAWRMMSKDKKEEVSKQPDIKLKNPDIEAPSADGITTVKEYSFEPAQRLPEVKGTSDYAKLDGDRTVKFAINVWAGWAPILYANGGLKPGKVWKDANGKDFKVELELIDNPVDMRNTFAAGKVHIGWATVDMLPLLVQGLWKDSRTRPRVFQQVDWSNSGDGIVVRDNIKSAADLHDKQIAYAANSPSHFFLLNVLINAGVQPSRIKSRTTPDAFQAAAAFNGSKDISAVVSWAPDIYKLADQPGNRMLVTTETANKLIADVWFARADFAKDHPEIIEGLVRGIFDGMIAIEEEDAAKQKAAEIMGKAYGLSASDASGMLADAHSTNYAENREFFLNANNPTNFKSTYENAHFLYQQIRGDDGKPLVGEEIPFDQIMDFSVIKKLQSVPKYANQKNNYQVQYTPASASSVQGAEAEILAKTVVINFFPNSFDLTKKVTRKVNGKEKEFLYDPNSPLVVKEIGQLAGQYGQSRIVIEGHTDSSMRGRVDDRLVKDLSKKRADSVKQAVIRKFPTIPADQFLTVGKGWDVPADKKNPNDHVKNRRVEVKVYPAEIQ